MDFVDVSKRFIDVTIFNYIKTLLKFMTSVFV